MLINSFVSVRSRPRPHPPRARSAHPHKPLRMCARSTPASQVDMDDLARQKRRERGVHDDHDTTSLPPDDHDTTPLPPASATRFPACVYAAQENRPEPRETCRIWGKPRRLAC